MLAKHCQEGCDGGTLQSRFSWRMRAVQAACETPDSSGGKGRRAHRKEKRASADARARMLASP